jgi:hypothetical protein
MNVLRGLELSKATQNKGKIMGTLKEGVQYIYERDGAITYAREFGANERQLIGMDYPITETVNWHDVVAVAKSNKALQTALHHAIMLYKLSKENVQITS